MAAWVLGTACDDASRQLTVDVVFQGHRLERVVGIDVLNGTVRELNVRHSGDGTLVKGMILRVWPTIISGLDGSQT